MRLIPSLLAAAICAACVPPTLTETPVPGAPPPAPAVAGSAPSPVSARLIGATLAEADTSGPGRWVAMAGVDRAIPGWVTDQETGRSAQVELRPLEGAGIDRISLDALLALGVVEARLMVLDVYYDAAALVPAS